MHSMIDVLVVPLIIRLIWVSGLSVTLTLVRVVPLVRASGLSVTLILAVPLSPRFYRVLRNRLTKVSRLRKSLILVVPLISGASRLLIVRVTGLSIALILISPLVTRVSGLLKIRVLILSRALALRVLLSALVILTLSLGGSKIRIASIMEVLTRIRIALVLCTWTLSLSLRIPLIRGWVPGLGIALRLIICVARESPGIGRWRLSRGRSIVLVGNR